MSHYTVAETNQPLDDPLNLDDPVWDLGAGKLDELDDVELKKYAQEVLPEAGNLDVDLSGNLSADNLDNLIKEENEFLNNLIESRVREKYLRERIVGKILAFQQAKRAGLASIPKERRLQYASIMRTWRRLQICEEQRNYRSSSLARIRRKLRVSKLQSDLVKARELIARLRS